VNNDGQITQVDVLEQKTTYPFGMFAFGMRASDYDPDRTDFTGHQVVGSNTDRYYASMDMQARYYSPGMASFVVVDPLASSMPSYSPYVYGFSNPVGYTDPTGMAPVGPGDPSKALLWAGKHVANFVNNTLPAGAQVAVGAFNYARGTSVGRFIEGTANSTAGAIVDVGTTTTFPLINQLGVIAN